MSSKDNRILFNRERHAAIDKKESDDYNTLSSRITALISKHNKEIAEVYTAIANAKTELNNTITSTKNELNTTITNTKTDLTNNINSTKNELNNTITSTKNDLTNNINSTKNELNNTITDTKNDLSSASSSSNKSLIKDYTDKINALETELNNTITNNAKSFDSAINELETKHNKDIDSLKKSVSDGKTLLANTLTSLGVNTASDASFSTINTNIGKLGKPSKSVSIPMRCSNASESMAAYSTEISLTNFKANGFETVSWTAFGGGTAAYTTLYGKNSSGYVKVSDKTSIKLSDYSAIKYQHNYNGGDGVYSISISINP